MPPFTIISVTPYSGTRLAIIPPNGNLHVLVYRKGRLDCHAVMVRLRQLDINDRPKFAMVQPN